MTMKMTMAAKPEIEDQSRPHENSGTTLGHPASRKHTWGLSNSHQLTSICNNALEFKVFHRKVRSSEKLKNGTEWEYIKNIIICIPRLYQTVSFLRSPVLTLIKKQGERLSQENQPSI